MVEYLERKTCYFSGEVSICQRRKKNYYKSNAESWRKLHKAKIKNIQKEKERYPLPKK